MPRFYLFIILSILLFHACKIGDKTAGLTLPVIERNDVFDFPLDWIGIYEGDLIIYRGPNDTTQIEMKLQIANPDKEGFYPWIMIYGENDIRNYGLESIDPERGYYVLDEFNSIKLDAYHRHNHLVSKFSVKGTDLTVDYERVQGGIDILFYVSIQKPGNITGGEIFESDTIPVVSSYQLAAFQKASLKKIR
ncbi:MAG: hypothetical protein HKO89_06430 [Saprospiraceae bacterium]|nr:hypothetical protein [Saprospiraceae bacterium]